MKIKEFYLKAFSPIFNVNIFFIGAILMTGSGCQSDGSLFIKDATGQPGEIVVVADPRYVREAHPVMDTLKAWFERPMRILPQPESFFKIFKIDDAHFGSIFKYHRNVLLLNIGAPPDAPTLSMQDDKWAKRQRVLQLNVQNENAFFEIFPQKRAEIEELFYQKDMERLAEDFDRSPASETRQWVKQATGITLSLPSGFFCADTGQGWAYVRHVAERSLPGGHKGTIERGLVVITAPYQKQKQFSVRSFLDDIGPLLRTTIQGFKDNTWMEVEPRVPCDSTAISLAGHYAMKIRGLWRLHGEFKGGPFVGLRFFHTMRKKLVTIFAYVYAPNFQKRTYVFQVEAIARSAGRGLMKQNATL
ncbi:MAG: DUF4837 family protein [Flavobacteriales bacterium]|nr:DUF4837 family protein [Flavobacteriales bacterium]MCX7768196.1 DUF4837 family protein [Flavobacteriales bacterium]MDW8409147.1 DUF4837 family protein [Flavobacteriales bacterium]